MIDFSIIKKSELEGGLRFDAEYYQSDYFIDFSKGDWIFIGVCLEKCQYGLSLAMNDDKKGYPIYKMNDINSGFLFPDDVRFVNTNKKIAESYFIEKNDIFFNRVNSDEFVGRTGIFKSGPKSVFASYLIRLRIKDNVGVLPDYLNIFLNSAYGDRQIKKFKRRAVNQANVNAEELKQFKILVPTIDFQKEIEKLSNESWKGYEDSKKFYTEAEELLLAELGLKNLQEDEVLFSIVNLSEVKEVERMDAEYFRSKYEKITKKIEELKWDFLGNLTIFINNGVQPPYIENGEIKFFSQKWIKDKVIDYNFLTDVDIPRVSKKFFDIEKNKPYLIKQNDILYYSVGANLGFCHNYLEKENIAIGSFINLIRGNNKKVNPIYLGFVLNSVIGRSQAEMSKSGLAQPYIYSKDLRRFKIPILSISIQEKIADLVKRSHEARKKSKELLEEAIQKVEDLIENNK